MTQETPIRPVQGDREAALRDHCEVLSSGEYDIIEGEWWRDE